MRAGKQTSGGTLPSSVTNATRTQRKGALTVAFDQISVNGRSYPIHATVTQALESEGLISSKVDSDRRVYSLTRTGRDALAKRREQLAEIEARHSVRFSSDGLDAALARFTSRVRSIDAPVESVEAILDRAVAEIDRERRS